MMGNVVSGSQQRGAEHLRLRAAGVTTNVFIFKHALALADRNLSIHQFPEAHSYYIIR